VRKRVIWWIIGVLAALAAGAYVLTQFMSVGDPKARF
jgi:hypothetical protein